jgi:arabinofuranosyltransferase
LIIHDAEEWEMVSKSWRAFLPITVIFLAQAWLYRAFFVDDALISFRYVQQFVGGNGLVYSVGEFVEGYSNFLWIIMLSPLHYFGVDLVLSSKVMGTMLSVATLGLTLEFAERFRFSIVAPLFLAVSVPFAAWSMGGLETPLFTFLLTASILTFVREEEQSAGWRSSLLFGLLALARPEGLVFAMVALGWRGWRLFRSRSRPTRCDALWLVVLGVIVVPYELWRFSYYGYLLPNTVYAKAMGLSLRPVLEGVYYLYRGLIAAGGVCLLGLPILLLFVQPRPAMWAKYLFVNVLVFALFVLVGGGDWMPMQRFAVHVLPLLMLLIHGGLARLSEALTVPRAAWLVGLLVVGQTLFWTMDSLEQRFVNGIASASDTATEDPTITFLRERIVPTDTIAVDAAGVFAFSLPLSVRVVDVNGLTDEHIAHQPAQFPGGLFGRGDGFGKWDVDYVLRQNPRFVQLAVTGTRADGDYTTLNTGQTLLVNDPRFREKYQPVDRPGVGGLFERR